MFVIVTDIDRLRLARSGFFLSLILKTEFATIKSFQVVLVVTWLTMIATTKYNVSMKNAVRYEAFHDQVICHGTQ